MLLLLLATAALAATDLNDLPAALVEAIPAAALDLARDQLAQLQAEGRAVDRGCVHLRVDGVYDQLDVSVEHTLTDGRSRDAMRLLDGDHEARWVNVERATVDAEGHVLEVTLWEDGDRAERRSERWRHGLRVRRVVRGERHGPSERVERWAHDGEGRERAFTSVYREGPVKIRVSDRTTYDERGLQRISTRAERGSNERCVTTSEPLDMGRVEHTDCGEDAAPVTRTLRWDAAGHPLLDDARTPFGDGSGDEVRFQSWTWEGDRLIASHREAPFVGERDTTWFWEGGQLVGRSEPGDDVVAVEAWWGSCPAWPVEALPRPQ